MFVLTLLITTLVLATCHWYYKRRRLPPGPPAVPLLGSLPFLNLRRGLTDWTLDPRVTRHNLATVTMGPESLFIINDFNLAKELFDKDEFSGRDVPEWMKVIKIINGKMRGILSTEGADWIKQRRFGLKTLRDLGFGRRTIEEIVEKEIDEITSKLGRYNSQDYILGSVFNIPVINVLWQLVAGHRFDENISKDKSTIDDIIYMFQNFVSLSTFPISITKLVRKTFFNQYMKMAHDQINYIRELIENHKSTLDKENPRDFIDVYLAAMEDDDGLNTDDLTCCLADFLVAGTETTANTLKWMVLYLTLHQEVQDRCREEIREVIGDKKCTLDDTLRMPYTKATVSEVQRLRANLVPSHRTVTSVEAEGFSFPPNATFIINLHFLLRDPKHFKDPEAFNPDRYKKNPALIPFGIGKRQCIGEALARNNLMLFTVGLIQRLSFLPPDSGAMPDPQDYHASVTRTPKDFPVKIRRN